MGGGAFKTNASLTIARLTPQEYHNLCPLVLGRLAPLFQAAQIPRAAPKKPSHGDIDIIAHSPIGYPSLARLSAALYAIAHLKGGSACSFALPFSAFSGVHVNNNDTAPEQESLQHEDEQAKIRCFQVDLSITSPAKFDFSVTIHEFGDTWMLIGSMIKRLDLSISDKGLVLMIPEIQNSLSGGRKKGKLLLTSEEREIFDFLGLDLQVWERGFATLEDLFMWIAGCRLYRREKFLKLRQVDIEVEPGGKLSGKARKEKKEEGRWMWMQFVEDWVPARADLGMDGVETKENMRAEVLNRWDKSNEYEKMLNDHRKGELMSNIWSYVAGTLPLEGKDLGEAMKEIKGLVNGNSKDLKTDTMLMLKARLPSILDASMQTLIAAMVGRIKEYRMVRGPMDDDQN